MKTLIEDTPPAVAAGMALLAGDGRLLFAHGLARGAAATALLADPTWRSGLFARRLLPLSLDGQKLIAFCTPVQEAQLVLFTPAPGDAVTEFLGSIDFAYDILHHLLTDPFEAMTVVDAEGRVAFLAPVHERFFGLGRGEGRGKPVREVIENTALDRVLATGKPEIGVLQRMRGQERVVSRVPIRRDGRIVGAIGQVMFKGPEQLEALSRRVNALEREVEFYRAQAAELRRGGDPTHAIVGRSPAILRLRQDIAKVAPLDMPVLVQGESGTGKELVARALHRLGPRRSGPLVVVNAAALPASLVESELFGYEAGSFTGADRRGRAGKFEQAHGGTIFLDEIGDMPLDVQAKLLRVLQDRSVERLGGSRAREIDFRLVTATHHNLEALVAAGRFRADLYYRISPVTLEVAPLSARRGDIPDLVQHFLAEAADRHARPLPLVDDATLAWLAAAEWPGNVRQLRHAVERALVFAEGGRLLPEDFRTRGAPPPPATPTLPAASPLRRSVTELEDGLIQQALRRCGGNKKRAAAELGISRSHLYKRLARALPA